jgi:CDGSH iron-sulfur domain-containing protein 3
VTVPTEKQGSTIIDSDMEENKEFKSQATIEIIDNGPIKVAGNILLVDSKRDITNKAEEVWLCRCGRSGNKPYCDESHKH